MEKGQKLWEYIPEIEWIPISSITPYENNAKKHPKAQVDALANSIRTFGWVQPLVIDGKNVITIGHGRLEAAKKLGANSVPCFRAEHLSEEQIKVLRLADNKLNESPWDMKMVKLELKGLEIESVELTGFSTDLILESSVDEDEVPEVQKVALSKRGDVFKLGNHRIMCGDSTNMDDVEKLMDGMKADMVLTDPPYNTGMKPRKGKNNGHLDHMFDDSYSPEAWEKFLNDIFANYYTFTKGEAAFYVCIDWRRVADVKAKMEQILDVTNVIVWDKVVHGLGSDYKYTYELIVVGKKGKPEIHNRFDDEYRDVWHIQRKIGKNKDHATAKPIELCERPIKHASKQDDIAIDLFLGSGSTLIACEKTQRICYGMEIDPHCLRKDTKDLLWYGDRP